MKRVSGSMAFTKNDWLGWAFIFPALLLFTLVLAFPIVYAIRMSFFDIALDFSQTFIGLGNFVTALQDKFFWGSVKITSIYMFSSVILSLVLGMIVALILNMPWIKGKRVLNLLFLVPWTISYVVTGAAWKWVLNAQYGVLNVILRDLGLISANISFFGDPDLALPAVIFVNVWRSMPFAMVMINAGLQSLPVDQVEAARVDGATAWQVFLHITLPNLRNVISVATVLLAIWTFVQFDMTQVLTNGGGPNHATELLSNLIYRVSFNYYQFGYGSAIAVLMLIIVLILTIIYTRILDRS
ncbi:MAG: sugar ABC transporter permease [Chloroflexi bacterium]|nr:sugar ABC transporter permease [Anaerolineaceae bacterium]NMB90730.1 sugar ABC transporter permease [Chloroflexota bacterium]